MTFAPPFKGHCPGDFAVFSLKLLKYLTKKLLCTMKLLLQHLEENVKVCSKEEQTIINL